MDVRELPLDELVLDPNLNLRDRLDDFTVERYADAWHRLPPITVFEVDGQWLLADGFHRHAAAVMMGRKTIPAEVRAGAFSDALDFVASVNLAHGLPLSRNERRRAIEVKLKLHHDWSDRRLAEELGVGRELVAKTRRQLVEGGQIPASTGRVGADGKTYPATGLPRDPNERRPRTNAEAGAEAGSDEPRERERRRREAPWDDTSDPLPPPQTGATGAVEPPWDAVGDARADAHDLAVASAAPTIDEMLQMMARQIVQIVSWTEAEGFAEAYPTASGNSRGLFQTAVVKLAARADRLRKGVAVGQ